MTTYKKFRKLKEGALRSAEQRGHKMADFDPAIKTARADKSMRYAASAVCTRCAAHVMVDTHPEPNGVDIGGKAVAMGCRTGR
jgi:hypothetical protein